MSDFIDEEFLISRHKSKYQSQISRQNSKEMTDHFSFNKGLVLKKLFKLIPNLATQYYVQNQSHSDTIELRLSFANCGIRSYNVLITIKIDLNKKSFQTFLSVLEGPKPYKIQTLNKRNLICKLFCKSTTQNLNKMSVSLSQGTFKALKPVHFFGQQEFNDYLISKQKEKSLGNYITKNVQEGIKIFKPVLRQLIEDFGQDSNENRRKSQQAIKRSIYRYVMKSSIKPSFEVSFGSGKYELMECLTKEESFYTNSLTQNIVTDFEEFSSHNLYLTLKVPLKNLRKLYAREYFTSNDEQLTILKTKIEPPGTRINLGLDSKYVYNMIEIIQNNKINLRKINGGGFSQISIAEVEFWYMMSASNQKMVKLDELRKTKQDKIIQNTVKKQHKKIMVFKSSKNVGNESVRNRIAHEIKIASKFKGTPSLFIPEYFHDINQKSQFSQYLIMEYLPCPTLNEYAEIHKECISFLTKIHLASLVVHSLQILKNNSIVHMDIKPSNIMVGKKMIVKLFDFGESYHREVCDKSYKPAFSNPYGSPEVVDNSVKIQFTQKIDIYSWAVVIWELIFKRYPFYFPFEKTAKVLRTKDYYKYIYYVPEQEGQYGSWEIMPFIRSVLMKAMDKDANNRPFSLWLIIVLKECLTHLINLECYSPDDL